MHFVVVRLYLLLSLSFLFSPSKDVHPSAFLSGYFLHCCDTPIENIRTEVFFHRHLAFLFFLAKLLPPLRCESLGLGRRGSYLIIYMHPFLSLLLYLQVIAFWESGSKVPSTFGLPLPDIKLKRIWSIDILAKILFRVFWLLFHACHNYANHNNGPIKKVKNKK